MSNKPQAALENAEMKLRRFLDAQTLVFEQHKQLTDWCRESLEGQHDQTHYDLAKRVFKDVVAFENAFEEFEVEFWNYIEDVEGARERLDHQVLALGFADHKEYFFSKIEACIARLSDVVTEVNASGFEWQFLDELENSLEALFDVSEDLIESDISQLGDGLVTELLEKIPPQRVAPLEVVASANSIRRRTDSRLQTRVSDASVRQAAIALHEVLSDTYEELQRSNCDPRIMKAFAKCLNEISGEFELFSPIRFGIYVGVANGFRDAVSEEFSAFLARQVISALMQCDIFLRNFQAWSAYSEEEQKAEASDSMALLVEFQEIAKDPLFDDGIRLALDDLAEDKRDFGTRKKVDYSVFQSISNVVSEVCRQGLRYISLTPRIISSLLAETARDGIKATLGVVAVIWLLRYSKFLVSISEQFPFFAWLKPVIEFIKTHFAG